MVQTGEQKEVGIWDFGKGKQRKTTTKDQQQERLEASGETEKEKY